MGRDGRGDTARGGPRRRGPDPSADPRGVRGRGVIRVVRRTAGHAARSRSSPRNSRPISRPPSSGPRVGSTSPGSTARCITPGSRAPSSRGSGRPGPSTSYRPGSGAPGRPRRGASRSRQLRDRSDQVEPSGRPCRGASRRKATPRSFRSSGTIESPVPGRPAQEGTSEIVPIKWNHGGSPLAPGTPPAARHRPDRSAWLERSGNHHPGRREPEPGRRRRPRRSPIPPPRPGSRSASQR